MQRSRPTEETEFIIHQTGDEIGLIDIDGSTFADGFEILLS